jgi:BirA family biotin operon repressor/biotin-[acetyl-CoA-carboxylase] ligase
MLSITKNFSFKTDFRRKLKSTNISLARMLKRADLEEGYLVYTDEQTGGVGQRNTFWESQPRKNLLFSFVIRPKKLELQKQFYLSIIVSLALVDLLKKHLPSSEVKIKWPNDIFIDDRKIAGVLIENAIQGSRFEWVIIGVGLNVNQEHFNIENNNPVSLKMILNKGFNRKHLLAEFEVFFAKRYAQLNNEDFEDLLSEYLNLMYRRDQWCTYYSKGIQFQGTILGIDQYGFLRMETSSGEKTFDVKEVEYLK